MVPSPRASQLFLWALFLLTVPVPYYLGGFEVAPAARLVFLSLLVLGVVATEGVGGYQAMFAALAVVQSVLWPLLLLAAATLGRRVLLRTIAERHRAGVLAGVAVVLIGISLLPIYSTELSSRGPSSSLAGLLD